LPFASSIPSSSTSSLEFTSARASPSLSPRQSIWSSTTPSSPTTLQERLQLSEILHKDIDNRLIRIMERIESSLRSVRNTSRSSSRVSRSTPLVIERATKNAPVVGGNITKGFNELDTLGGRLNAIEELISAVSDDDDEDGLTRARVYSPIPRVKMQPSTTINGVENSRPRSWPSILSLEEHVGVENSTTNKPPFLAQVLPKIRFGDDVDEWVTKLELAMKIWGESVVCPYIPFECFQPGDTMHTWFWGLARYKRTDLTEGTRRNWIKFKYMVQSIWGKPRYLKAEEASRYKAIDAENYVKYCVQKLHLMRSAHPRRSGSFYIDGIKQGTMPWVGDEIKETKDVEKFLEEVVRHVG
jgi:hypothetical protein